MENVRDTFLRTKLVDRQQRLKAAISGLKDRAELVYLLQEVDAALERMDKGSYGLCETCHDPIENERLMMDPVMRTCLGHLTPDQQRALEQDFELAWRVQSGLLPRRHLTYKDWEVCYHYEPAGPVSGDYCDLVVSEAIGEEFVFLLGDISGKGVAASLLMAHLHATFRSLIDIGLPLSALLERANRVFCESSMSTHYATLVCGRAKPSGEMEICNAGHCPPLLLRESQVTRLESTSLPLGLFSTGKYSLERIHLKRGDALLLYTDGLSESVNRSNSEYGVERLSRLIGDRYELTPQALITACLDDVKAFRSSASSTDDLTIMVMRYAG